MPRSCRRLLAIFAGAILLLVGTVAAESTILASSGSAVSTRAGAVDGCGATTLWKAPGVAWTCSFADNFDGSALDRTKWVPAETATNGFHSGVECVMDRPANLQVANGTLRLTARKESSPFTCKSSTGADRQTQYTGASISTWSTFSQVYGRFEIRAKFPSATVAGVHSALWMYPAVPKYAWPHSGEIDIAEFYSKNPDRAVPYVHYVPSAPDPSVTNNYCMLDQPDTFHTYVAEWSPTGVTISYDGVTCLEHAFHPAAPLTGHAPFDFPFIVALSQGLGIAGNAFDPATTPLPATTEVDYVRIWS